MSRTMVLSSLASAIVGAASAVLVLLWIGPQLGGHAAVVRAEHFEVVDEQGHVTARLGGSPRNPSLAILDRGGTERVGLKLLADGTSMVYVEDGQGRVRTHLYVNAGGSATALQFFDDHGNVREIVDPSGSRQIAP